MLKKPMWQGTVSGLQNLTVGYCQQLVKSRGSQSLSQEMNSANNLNELGSVREGTQSKQIRNKLSNAFKNSFTYSFIHSINVTNIY